MFLKQLWVAVRIWLIAIVTNTVLGSLFLSGGLDPDLMFLGSFFGAIYSFPIMVVLLIIINRCIAKKLNGLAVFRFAFVSALALTVIDWKVFTLSELNFPQREGGLLIVALLAAIAGVASQYNPIFKLAHKREDIDSYLL